MFSREADDAIQAIRGHRQEGRKADAAWSHLAEASTINE
jgi:hypothetical protein